MRHSIDRRAVLLAPALLAPAVLAIATATWPGKATAADAAGLVQALTSQLGISQPQARGGTGALFNLAQQRMAPDQFGQVQSAVPGIGDLMQNAPALGGQSAGSQGAGAQGGGLGGLAGGALGGMTGDNSAGGLGSLAPLVSSFSSLGLSPDMVSKFLPVVMQYLNSSGGSGAAGLLQGALMG
jgi:hypothetical protein